MSSPVPFSLAALHTHSIFLPATAQPEDDWELVDRPGEPSVPARKSRLAIRDKDLIVAMGKELRMTHLSGEPWEVQEGRVGGYKSLTSPHLSFPIQAIVPSPSGNLLAVVGSHQIVVLALPKSTVVGSTSGELPCRSFTIDEYVYSASSPTTISQIRWHPLGEAGNSLWILSSDGKLRQVLRLLRLLQRSFWKIHTNPRSEYDLLHPSDPAQTFSFLPSASSSKFSAVDPLSRFATAFAFGSSPGWGELVVHCLMANGDMYALGPILPLRTEVPVQWLQRLKAVADAHRQLASEGGGVLAMDQGGEERVSMQSEWVEALVRQATVRRDEAAPPTPSRRTSILSGRPRTEVEVKQPEWEGTVKLHPPHLTASGGPAPGIHRSLLRQGPVVFSPAPTEEKDEDEDEEDVASDLLVWSAGGVDGEEDGVGVMAIAWSSGRVDLGVETEPVEPRWVGSRDPSTMPITIPLIESVVLKSPALEGAIAPCFVPDALRQDVFYVQHALGVDSISVSPWVTALREDRDDLPHSDVARLVESHSSRPVEGLAAFSTVTLGYGLLALASTNQLAAIELEYQIPRRQPSPSTTLRSSEPDRSSLLLTQPLDFAKLLSSARSARVDPKAALRKLPSPNQPVQSVSPEHLRVVGEMIAQLQNRLAAIRSASQAIEHRVDIQIREFQRQLELLKKSSATIKALKNDDTAERAEKMLEKQDKLAERMDRVVAALSADYRPEIGEVEKKWFDELEKLRTMIHGGGGFGLSRTRGLTSQVEQLKEQLAAVKPSVEAAGTLQEPPEARAYSPRQLKPLETALKARSEEIRRLMKRMETLSFKVEAAETDAANDDA